jgi:hypothetical protein
MLRHGVTQKWKTLGGLLLGYFKDSRPEFFSGCTIVWFLTFKKKFEFLASKTTELQNAEPWRNPS